MKSTETVAKIEFSQVLHESILKGLKNALGETSAKVVLLNMKSTRYVDSPEEFHRDLYAIFNEGALSLEKVIVKELFCRLSVPFEEKGDFGFAASVKCVKDLLVTRQKSITGDQNGEEKFPH